MMALLLMFVAPIPARAALAPVELDAVGLAPEPGATLPGDLAFTDAGGRRERLADLFGRRPAVLILADYDCREICGPILSVAGHALAGTGLAAGRDYDLIAIGINPRATAADAARMSEAQLSDIAGLAASAHLLSGPPVAIAAVERSLNYRAAYDEASGRYAHPADILVLTPNGAVSRVLPGLSLDPQVLRLALVEAGQGRIGTIGDRLHLLCYGLDPARGVANGVIGIMLTTGDALTLAGLGAFLMALRRRRPAPGSAAGAASEGTA